MLLRLLGPSVLHLPVKECRRLDLGLSLVLTLAQLVKELWKTDQAIVV
jgi:hypothetical protein